MRKQQTRVRATWYLLALVPLAIGAAMVGLGLHVLSVQVERMPRVLVPGTSTVELDVGDYNAYGELRSVVGGTAYVTNSLHLRCGLNAVDDGTAITLSVATTKTEYMIAGFHGEPMFALSIPRAGRYQLTCEGEGGPATMAFGRGIGPLLLTLLLGAPIGFVGAIVVALVVRRRRRRARPADPVPAA